MQPPLPLLGLRSEALKEDHVERASSTIKGVFESWTNLGKRGLAMGGSVSMETNLVSLKVSERSPGGFAHCPLRSPSARDRADRPSPAPSLCPLRAPL